MFEKALKIAEKIEKQNAKETGKDILTTCRVPENSKER